MKRLGFALACAALWTSTAGAQEATTQPPPAPTPSPPPLAQTRSVQLSRVVIDPAIPRENQRVKVGTICLFAGPPLNFGTERTLNYEHFERIFSTTMSGRQINVIARSSNLFDGEGNSPAAEFLVGAIVRPQSVDICDSASGQKGTITLAVEWQIYDRNQQRVVETTTTRGSGRVERFQLNGLGAMTDQAFSASLAELIDQGVIQRHLGNPAQ